LTLPLDAAAGTGSAADAGHYDALESRDPADREAALMARLPALLDHARRHAPGYARIFDGIEPAEIRSRAAFAQVPVTRKSELKALQTAVPPLGGLNAIPIERFAKLFVSPGPLYEAEGYGVDWWRTARALHAAGFRPGDRVTNTFGYHMTPAGSIFESGALACGCVVLPGGVGQTEGQAAAIAALRICGFIGTPSFLDLIVQKADEQNIDLSCLRKAMVAAEYLPPALRRRLGERGLKVMQSYATAEVGLVAYESTAGGVLCDGMIVDEGILLEIVEPGTGRPVADGEVGEVLVTRFNEDYPLIRFALGDLSATLAGPSPCGRTNTRIKGWLGRADQSAKVRGIFVHPSQIADIQRRHPEVLRARLVIDLENERDRMVLHCEVAAGAPAALKTALAATARDVTRLRTEVELRVPGSLPQDGRAIEDARGYGVTGSG